jgi:hypothetical protein
MKRLFLLLIALCAGAQEQVVFGPAAYSGEEKVAALDLGFQLASRIPQKPHAVDRGRSQYDVLKVYVDAGFVEHAERRASEILNWRRAAIFADIAEHYLDKKDGVQAYAYLRKALDARSVIAGTRGWQRERVTGRVAALFAKAGDREGAVEIAEGLDKVVAFQAQMDELTDVSDIRRLDEKLARLGKLSEAVEMEVQQAAAEGYIRVMEQLGGHFDAARFAQIKEAVYALGVKVPEPIDIRLRCKLARALQGMGENERALQVANEVDAHIRRRKLEPRFDVRLLAEIALLWHELDRDDRVVANLAKAKELNAAAKGTSIDLVRVARDLAWGYGMCDKREDAIAAFGRAIDQAAAQRNGRPRMKLLAGICAAMGECELVLTPELRSKLEAEIARQVSGW